MPPKKRPALLLLRGRGGRIDPSRKHRFTPTIADRGGSAHLGGPGWMESVSTECSHPASAIDADETAQRDARNLLKLPRRPNSG